MLNIDSGAGTIGSLKPNVAGGSCAWPQGDIWARFEDFVSFWPYSGQPNPRGTTGQAQTCSLVHLALV